MHRPALPGKGYRNGMRITIRITGCNRCHRLKAESLVFKFSRKEIPFR